MKSEKKRKVEVNKSSIYRWLMGRLLAVSGRFYLW